MPLQPKFNRFSTASPIIASYDFIDVQSGLGIRRFFPSAVQSSGGVDYILGTKVVEAKPLYTTSGNVPTTSQSIKMIDIDFDSSPFQLASNINGVGFINFTTGVVDEALLEAFFIVKLIKYSNTVETIIATVQTANQPTGGNTFIRHALNMSITKTNFKKGDLLRITIEGWAADTGGGTSKLRLYHDPVSTNTITDIEGDTRGTDIIIDIPFEVNI